MPSSQEALNTFRRTFSGNALNAGTIDEKTADTMSGEALDYTKDGRKRIWPRVISKPNPGSSSAGSSTFTSNSNAAASSATSLMSTAERRSRSVDGDEVGDAVHSIDPATLPVTSSIVGIDQFTAYRYAIGCFPESEQLKRLTRKEMHHMQEWLRTTVSKMQLPYLLIKNTSHGLHIVSCEKLDMKLFQSKVDRLSIYRAKQEAAGFFRSHFYDDESRKHQWSLVTTNENLEGSHIIDYFRVTPQIYDIGSSLPIDQFKQDVQNGDFYVEPNEHHNYQMGKIHCTTRICNQDQICSLVNQILALNSMSAHSKQQFICRQSQAIRLLDMTSKSLLEAHPGDRNGRFTNLVVDLRYGLETSIVASNNRLLRTMTPCTELLFKPVSIATFIDLFLGHAEEHDQSDLIILTNVLKEKRIYRDFDQSEWIIDSVVRRATEDASVDVDVDDEKEGRRTQKPSQAIHGQLSVALRHPRRSIEASLTECILVPGQSFNYGHLLLAKNNDHHALSTISIARLDDDYCKAFYQRKLSSSGCYDTYPNLHALTRYLYDQRASAAFGLRIEAPSRLSTNASPAFHEGLISSFRCTTGVKNGDDTQICQIDKSQLKMVVVLIFSKDIYKFRQRKFKHLLNRRAGTIELILADKDFTRFEAQIQDLKSTMNYSTHSVVALLPAASQQGVPASTFDKHINLLEGECTTSTGVPLLCSTVKGLFSLGLIGNRDSNAKKALHQRERELKIISGLISRVMAKRSGRYDVSQSGQSDRSAVIGTHVVKMTGTEWFLISIASHLRDESRRDNQKVECYLQHGFKEVSSIARSCTI